MIFITQFVYVVEGQEAVFHQFEEVALPLIATHNGKLLLRVRPSAAAFIAGEMELPYEIHLVEFSSAQDFENYKSDETRKQFLHLKAQSVRASVMIQGEKLG